jgi:hypothetical protein
MSNDPTDPGAAPTDEVSADEVAGTPELDAYDLDHDGKISIVEAERARLGLVDARLEELAEHDGVKGKLAKAAHEVIDKLDND